MSVNTYNKILTKGPESALPNTYEDGKLRFTTDTGRMFVDNTNERIEITDFVKGLTEEEITNQFAPLVSKIYIASDTDKMMYYDTTSGWVELNSAEADYATNAGTATYANNAASATNASSAVYATNADTAAYATNSGTATYATNAGTSTYATKASSSDIATNATSADFAVNATSAVYATNASTADYATNASSSVYATNADTSSYAVNSSSAVYATNASSATYSTNAGDAATVNGLTVTNDFVGTQAEWNALTTEQKIAYDRALITDDYNAPEFESAGNINYDNTHSTLDSLDVQNAIDELDEKVKTIFEGTQAEWNALTTKQKITYDYAVIKE